METEMLRYGRLCHGPIARPPSVLARPTNMFFLIFVSVFEGGESECEGVMAGGDYGGGVGVVWAVTHDGLVPTVAHHNRSYDLVGLGDFSSSGVEEVGGRAGGDRQPAVAERRAGLVGRHGDEAGGQHGRVGGHARRKHGRTCNGIEGHTRKEGKGVTRYPNTRRSHIRASLTENLLREWSLSEYGFESRRWGLAFACTPLTILDGSHLSIEK
jgi:hypothetical protein